MRLFGRFSKPSKVLSLSGVENPDGGPRLPADVPVEHQCIFDLSEPTDDPRVTIKSKFSKTCRLVLDNRTHDRVKIIVTGRSEALPENVDLVVGQIKRGRIVIRVTGSNVSAHIGSSLRLFAEFKLGDDALVRVGDGTTSSGITFTSMRGEIRIGADCMSGEESMVMSARHHGVVDLSSGQPEIIDERAKVHIGDHVWIGYRSFIGGRADIGSGSIVAATSSVVGKTPKNCLIAGNPAKVRRLNVGWSRNPNGIDDISQAFFEAQLASGELNASHEQPLTQEGRE